MWNKSSIFIIVSDKRSNIQLSLNENYTKFSLCKNNYKEDKQFGRYIKLYVTSNKSIKQGDWCFDKLLNIIFKTDETTNFEYINKISSVSKIISTNDDLLELPKISDSSIEDFIKIFTKKYNNRNNFITNIDCIVEYTNIEIDSNSNIKEIPIIIDKENQIVKLNSNNTINIKFSEKNYTEEEVRSLCYKAFIYHKCVEDKIAPSDAMNLIEPFKEWADKYIH